MKTDKVQRTRLELLRITSEADTLRFIFLKEIARSKSSTASSSTLEKADLDGREAGSDVSAS